MKLYENVVIGNFLYGLGVSIGNRLKSGYLPGAVSLLQQTPEDKALGDVLLEFPGTLRLIEFKAQGNHSTKERRRHSKLSTILKGKQEFRNISCRGQEMLTISRRVHWYVETAPSPLKGVEAFFLLTLMPSTQSNQRSNSLHWRNTLNPWLMMWLLQGVMNGMCRRRSI